MSIRDLISSSLSEFDSYYALKNLKNSQLILEYINGEPIGFTELKQWGKIGIIFYLGVLPKFRGRGIGKKLILRAENVFREKGLEFSLASTRSWNKPAMKMFESLGYKFFNIDNVSDKIVYILNAYDDNTVVCKELVKGVECEKLVHSG